MKPISESQKIRPEHASETKNEAMHVFIYHRLSFLSLAGD